MTSATPRELRIRLRAGFFQPRAEIVLDRDGITFPVARLQWHRSLTSILKIPAPPSRRILWPDTRPLQITRDHSGQVDYVFGEGDTEIRVLDSELEDPELFRNRVEAFSGSRFESKFPTSAPLVSQEVDESTMEPSRALPSGAEVFYVVPFSSARLAIFLWSCLSLMSAIALLIALSLVFNDVIPRFMEKDPGRFVVLVFLAGAMLLPWLRHKKSRYYIAVASDGLYSALPSRFPRFVPSNQIQDFTLSEIGRSTTFQLIGSRSNLHQPPKRFTLYTGSGTYAIEALDIPRALSGKLQSHLAHWKKGAMESH
jgi:hypothetical protein